MADRHTPVDASPSYFAPTRLVRSRALSSERAAVWLKLENELPTGSFKVRGALHALSIRLRTSPVSEVVAASTGNHGAAVAWAARQLGVRARIFVPTGANPVKADKIRSLGAELSECGATLTDAIGEAERYASATGTFLLADAQDAHIPVGAGGIGSEIAEQLPDVHTIYVGVGDTALIRGVASAAKAKVPHVRVIGVQAAGAPAYYRSWKSGRAETTAAAETIADGLATTHALQPNVDAIRELVDDFQLVSDDEMLDAIAFILREEHIVIEPAAASTVAAFMRAPRDGNTVLVISGGNIAPSVLNIVKQRRTAHVRPSVRR